MKKAFLIFAAFMVTVATTFNVQAASSLGTPKIWIENSGDWFSGDYATNGKARVYAGMFGHLDLTSLVASDPQALQMARRSNQYNRYAIGTYWGGFALFLGGLLVSDNNNYSAGWFLGGALAWLTSTMFAVHFANESRHWQFGAINHYNGLGDSASNSNSFNNLKLGIIPQQGGGMLALHLSF